MIGLPVPLMASGARYETVKRDLVSGYRCLHQFTVGKDLYEVTVHKIATLAQPVGAYLDWALDSNARLRRGAREARVAILDIGMFTLHLYVVCDRKVEPRFTAGEELGVHRLLDRLDRHVDLEEMDADLRAGKLRPDPAAVNSWLAEILGVVEQTWEDDLERFDVLLPVGGGALLLGEQLREALTDRGANVAVLSDPVTANVRGLSKSAEYMRKAKGER
jgi:hypothetical protein